MSIAGRHGKLSERTSLEEDRWQRIEDLLTADVFGAYRYLPPHVGVAAFLERAVKRGEVQVGVGGHVGSLESVDGPEQFRDQFVPPVVAALKVFATQR